MFSDTRIVSRDLVCAARREMDAVGEAANTVASLQRTAGALVSGLVDA